MKRNKYVSGITAVLAILLNSPTESTAATITTSCLVGVGIPGNPLFPTGECHIDYAPFSFTTNAIVLSVSAIRLVDGATAAGQRYIILPASNQGPAILGPIAISCNNLLSALEMSATGVNYQLQPSASNPRVLIPVIMQVSTDIDVGPMGINQPPQPCTPVL